MEDPTLIRLRNLLANATGYAEALYEVLESGSPVPSRKAMRSVIEKVLDRLEDMRDSIDSDWSPPPSPLGLDLDSLGEPPPPRTADGNPSPDPEEMDVPHFIRRKLK